MLRLICGYALQGERSLEEKQSFYDESKGEWDMHSAGDLVICLLTLVDTLVGILMGSWSRYGVGHRNSEGRGLVEYNLQKELCMSSTWFKEEKRKVKFRMGENETGIDLVLIKTEH